MQESLKDVKAEYNAYETKFFGKVKGLCSYVGYVWFCDQILINKFEFTAGLF